MLLSRVDPISKSTGSEMLRFFRSVARGTFEVFSGWASWPLGLNLFLVTPFLLGTSWGRRLQKYLVASSRRRWTNRLKAGRQVWAGPFVGEVGYELSYWIPFVRSLQVKAGAKPDSVGIVTRGGAQAWYPQHGESFELLDVFTPEQYLEIQSAEWPIALRRQERKLVRDLGISRRSLMHPREMHLAIHAFRGGRESLESTLQLLEFASLQLRPSVADSLSERERLMISNLPREFCALRLYSNSMLGGPENVELAWESILQSTRREFVDLATNLQLDDHQSSRISRKLVAAPLLGCRPSVNLLLQTLILSRASCFVSTYGGISYLGPLLKVPTLVLSLSSAKQKPAHVEMENHLADLSDVAYERAHLDDPQFHQQLKRFLKRHTVGPTGIVI